MYLDAMEAAGAAGPTHASWKRFVPAPRKPPSTPRSLLRACGLRRDDARPRRAATSRPRRLPVASSSSRCSRNSSKASRARLDGPPSLSISNATSKPTAARPNRPSPRRTAGRRSPARADLASKQRGAPSWPDAACGTRSALPWTRRTESKAVGRQSVGKRARCVAESALPE